MASMVKHPLILWAQRSQYLYLAIEVEDMNVEELTIEEDKFKIKGKKGNDNYSAELELFGKLKGSERRKIATDRRVEFVIPKEKEEWWPRLIKEKTKVPWIKVDFDKWKDEDDEKEDDAFGGMDFSSFGLPSGGKGFDDLDMDDDEGGDLDDMGELEDIEDACEDKGSAKQEENGEKQENAKEEEETETSTASKTD